MREKPPAGRAGERPHVAGVDLPRQAVVRQVPPGQGGVGGVLLNTGEGQPLRPAGQQQQEGPRAAAQIAHTIPPPHRREGPQGQGVRPQGEAGVRLPVEIGPQPLRRSHGVCSNRCLVMRPVRPQMGWPGQSYTGTSTFPPRQR